MSPDGTKWPPQRKLATGYTVAIAVLIIDLLITFWNLHSISRTWDALALSHEVVVGLDDVLSNLRDAETGQRGYLLTGDERYLDPYTRKSHAVEVATSIGSPPIPRREQRHPAGAPEQARGRDIGQALRTRADHPTPQGWRFRRRQALSVVQDRPRQGPPWTAGIRSEVAAMGGRSRTQRASA